MLVNLKEILAIAEERKCAVGAFNTPNLECLLAVIDAAEKLGTPRPVCRCARSSITVSPLHTLRGHWRLDLPALCMTEVCFLMKRTS